MQKINPTINYVNKKLEINGPYNKEDYKTMKEVFNSIMENHNLQISKDMYERLEKVYKINPAYAINDNTQIESNLPFGDNYLIRNRYKYPTSAISSLEKAIILLYKILKKIYDSELQQDCNPLNHIMFDNPNDYTFLDATIKEILKEEKDE